MSEYLSPNEWIEISAYLDGRLDDQSADRLEKRLETDNQFHQAYLELKHARRLLKSLPAKKAPRNFTLSAQFAKSPARKWNASSFLGLASAASALLLVFLFVRVNFFSMGNSAMPVMLEAPSAKEAVPQAAMDTGAAVDATVEEAPMIITWGDPNRGYGMGGGGGDGSDMMVAEAPPADGGDFSGNGAILPQGTQVVEETTLNAQEAVEVDPSTMILGLPEPDSTGEIIQRHESEADVMSQAVPQIIPASTWWMIGLGAAALLSGLLAILLRRR